MNEFSDVGSEVMSSNTIHQLKEGSGYLDYQDSKESKDTEVQPTDGSEGGGARPSSASLEVLLKNEWPSTGPYAKYGEYFEGSQTLAYDIFKLSESAGRHNVLSFLVAHAINLFELRALIDEPRTLKFLSKVYRTYREDIAYHNDLHGADVMQMALYMLTTCGLREGLRLNKLDCLSMIIAAACHDLGHDGFTNGYHVNAITRRAIDSNDVSVQESFHVAELFRILDEDATNLISTLKREEFKIFRKRVIGLILATDMARHVADLSSLNALLSDFQIKDGEVNLLFIDKD